MGKIDCRSIPSIHKVLALALLEEGVTIVLNDEPFLVFYGQV
jgi:hypothetical protein